MSILYRVAFLSQVVFSTFFKIFLKAHFRLLHAGIVSEKSFELCAFLQIDIRAKHFEHRVPPCFRKMDAFAPGPFGLPLLCRSSVAWHALCLAVWLYRTGSVLAPDQRKGMAAIRLRGRFRKTLLCPFACWSRKKDVFAEEISSLAGRITLGKYLGPMQGLQNMPGVAAASASCPHRRDMLSEWVPLGRILVSGAPPADQNHKDRAGLAVSVCGGHFSAERACKARI